MKALAIGCIWLMLTPSFEFLFGHYVMGHPWSRLLYDYNLFAGAHASCFVSWEVDAVRRRDERVGGNMLSKMTSHFIPARQ